MQPSSVPAGPCGKHWATSRTGAGSKDALPLRSVLSLSLAAMRPAATNCARSSAGDAAAARGACLLGLKRAPCHAMYHYFYKALDVAATEQASAPGGKGPDARNRSDRRQAPARERPAGHDGSEGVHVVAAFASQLGAVIGQVQVAPEATRYGCLGAAQEAAAGGSHHHRRRRVCQRAICQGVRDRKGDDLFTVKANQPHLMADIALAWTPPWSSSRPGRAGRSGGRPCTGRTLAALQRPDPKVGRTRTARICHQS